MRKLFATLAVAAGLIGATTAQAGPLIAAQLTFQLATLPPATFTATGLLGGSASGTGGGASWTVGAGAVPGGVTTATIPTSAAPPITQLQFIVNGNPASAAFAASVDQAMAVTGAALIKFSGGLTLLGVPLVVGAPTIITPPVAAGIGVTGFGNSWTTKTTSIFATAANAAVTQMGFNGLVNGGGTVVLVTALNVLTNVAGQLPSFAILVLQYAPDSIPEPGTLMLLGSGIAGLALIGRRKLQK